MLTFADEEAHLRSANDHLRNAVYLIAVQQDRVERQRAAAQDTASSDALLSLMNETLRNFIQHRQAIYEALEAARRRRLGVQFTDARAGGDGLRSPPSVPTGAGRPSTFLPCTHSVMLDEPKKKPPALECPATL